MGASAGIPGCLSSLAGGSGSEPGPLTAVNASVVAESVIAESGLAESGLAEYVAGGVAKSGLRSPTFVGFVATQFLGAFNDNYFKQMVLLSCVAQLAVDGKDRQPLALAAFALPFVLLSGLGGFLSDRHSKTRVIVLCKVGEIVIMGLALLVLLLPGISSVTQLLLLIGVLACMGVHSAIFGPAKYGVLPELFATDRLLPANGIVQMTTFLAIIFGVVCAGIALDQLDRSLWQGSLIAMGIAGLGTLTSLAIRRTGPAQPQLPFRWEDLALPREVRALLRREPELLRALLVATMFWFIGGVTQPAVNILGSKVLGLSDTRTSLLTAGLGIGIAAGCVSVGVVGRNGGGVWVMRGAWGVVASLFAIGVLGHAAGPAASEALVKEPIWGCLVRATPLEWALRVCMVLLGLAAGVFVVPIQAYLQQLPPADLKGRVVGVQNLFSWIGILLSAVFLGVANLVLGWLFEPAEAVRRQYSIFLVMAVMMLPVALWYRLARTGELAGADEGLSASAAS